MHPVIQKKRPQVEAICRRYGVERLDLFGSAARDEYEPGESDFDFVVKFFDPHNRGYADRYLDLAEELEKLFGRAVDLLTERSVRNPIFKEKIASDRRTLYGG